MMLINVREKKSQIKIFFFSKSLTKLSQGAKKIKPNFSVN